MKKILMMALIALATGTTAFAGPKTVSTKATEHFAAAFKNAKNVNWKVDNRYDKVSFVLDGEKVDAFYDVFGELIGTSKTAAFDKLPKNAIEVITTKYTFPEYQLKDCIEFTTSDNEKNYYVSFDKQNETVVLAITKGGSVSVFAKKKK
jgi:hypothetical protein